MKGGDKTGVTVLMILLETDQRHQTLAMIKPYSELYCCPTLFFFILSGMFEREICRDERCPVLTLASQLPNFLEIFHLQVSFKHFVSHPSSAICCCVILSKLVSALVP